MKVRIGLPRSQAAMKDASLVRSLDMVDRAWRKIPQSANGIVRALKKSLSGHYNLNIIALTMSSRDDILRLIRRDKQARSRDLVKALGISRQTIAHHLKHLVAEGRLLKTGSTQNAVYHR